MYLKRHSEEIIGLREKKQLQLNKKFSNSNREIYFAQLRTIAIISVVCAHIRQNKNYNVNSTFIHL